MLAARRSLPALLALVAGAAALPAARAEAPADLTRARAEALERLFLRPGPSVKLSTVYAQVPEAQRHQLLEQVRQMVLAQVPPGVLEDPALDQLPPAARFRLKALLGLLKTVTPEQMDAFVQGQDLDHLAPVPSHLFQVYHRKAMAEAVPGTATPRGELLARDRADPGLWRQAARATDGFRRPGEAPPRTLEILAAGDPVPTDEVPREARTPAFGGMGLKVSLPVEAPERVLVNSVRAARAFNHLTNAGYQERPLEVRIGEHRAAVRDGVELVNALQASGRYDLAVFDARMFVNFVNLWVPHGEHLLPVRVPTWIATGMAPDGRPARPGEELIVPANHAEHLLVAFRKGTAEPEVMVRWFMAIPTPGVDQGTIYKPALWQRAGWSGYRIVRGYAGIESARQMARGAELLMRLYNFVQDRYGFERNGYGVLGVCNDTSGLLEAALMGRSGASTVWPLIRDPQLDFYYAGVLERLGIRMHTGGKGERVLDVPSDARPDHYPWLSNPEILQHRVGANVPARDPGTLHFPLLRGWLTRLAAEAPAFRRSLGMLAVTH